VAVPLNIKQDFASKFNVRASLGGWTVDHVQTHNCSQFSPIVYQSISTPPLPRYAAFCASASSSASAHFVGRVVAHNSRHDRTTSVA
jgi:hypothetical protein